jgi:hypothetical protein
VLWQAGEVDVDVSVFSLAQRENVRISAYVRGRVCVCIRGRVPPERQSKEGVVGSVCLTSADCGRSTVVCTAL